MARIVRLAFCFAFLLESQASAQPRFSVRGVDAAVHGNVRLDSVDTRGGHPYLTISMNLTGAIRGIPLPPGTTLRGGSMTLAGHNAVGLTAAAPEKASESTMDFEAVFSVRPPGARADVVMRMRRHSASTDRSTSQP